MSIAVLDRISRPRSSKPASPSGQAEMAASRAPSNVSPEWLVTASRQVFNAPPQPPSEMPPSYAFDGQRASH